MPTVPSNPPEPGPAQLPLPRMLDRVRAALRPWPPSSSQALVILAVAAAYFVTAWLGLLFAMPGGHVTPVWPPSGLALAAMLIIGRKIWPGIWLGSFAANLWGFLHMPGDVPVAASLVSAAGIGAGAAATAWLGAELLRRFVGAGNPIERVRDVCAFMGLGGVISCLFSASNGVLWLVLGGFAPWSAGGSVWLTWWLGDTAGVFVFAPLLLAWCVPASFPRRPRWAEACMCFALLLVVSYSVFVGETTLAFRGRPFTFVIIPFLVWPALRFGQRGAATAALAVACLAVWGTIHGRGPFELPTLNESLLVLELFLSVVSLTALCIAAVAAEQSHAEAGRRRVVDELESRVRERTAALVAEIAERTNAERKLADREAHLRAIVDSEPECVKLLSADGALLEMNPAGLAMIEADSLAQVQGAKMARLLAPESREAFVELTRRVFAGGSGQLEFAITGLKGGHRWLETHAVPLRGAGGKVHALLGITRDITGRKQDEALLSGQKQVLEMIAVGVPLAETLVALLRVIEAQSPEMLCSVLLLDPDGTHLRHGAAPSLPETYMRAIDGIGIGANAGSCGTAAFRGEPVIVEDIATDPLWAEYRAVALPHGLRACWSTPIFDAQRKVRGTFAIYYRQPGRPTARQLRLIDIATQTAAIAIGREQTLAALRVSESRHRRLLESNIIGVMIANTDGRITESNDLFLRTVGYTREDLQAGRVRWDTMTPPDWRAVDEHILHELKANGVCPPVEKEYLRKDGRRVPVVASVTMLEGTAGECICLIGDLTGRKEAEAALRALSRRLLQAEDEERRRIAKELHDSTAQDLVAVILNLGLLRDALPPPAARPAQILEDSVALLENSANDIRTLSYSLHPPRLDETGLPGGLTEYAAGLGRRADLRIRVEAAPDFGRLPEELELVLFRVAQESLSNVVRHSESDAATVRLAREDGGIVLEIEDYGRGMPPADTLPPGARGVGITGMRERLQHLGGRLEIESGSRGTTVRAVVSL